MVVVCLGVAVLVVAIFALREPNGHVSSAGTRAASGVAKQSSTPPKSSTPSKSAPSTPPSSRTSSAAAGSGQRAPLVVLNNTTIPHLAEQAAQRFEAAGWTVTRYDNYQNNILSTCAYYDPANPDAKAAAEALRAQFPTIKRVKPQFSELSVYDSPVVVILTPDYSSG